MVLLASDFDRSKYLRASDLDGEEEARFKIKHVSEETVGQGTNQERKLVVWFTNDQRGLVLNKTNIRTLLPAFGDDTAAWVGKIIIIYRDETHMAGKRVPCLRVRIPAPKAAAEAKPEPKSKPPLKDELDDDIPDNLK
jgi:hypothetical protein